MKLKLRNLNSCDGCEQLKSLGTLAGHKQCRLYKKNMLPMDDVTAMLRKQESKGEEVGQIVRPQICKDENEAEVIK